MSASQSDRARAFRALHERPGAFVIPNPYDIGTARILAGLGFEALATTSAGCAGWRPKRSSSGAIIPSCDFEHATRGLRRGCIRASRTLPLCIGLSLSC